MPKALSFDLRTRVLPAIDAGLSCRQAAARFGVSASSAICHSPIDKSLVLPVRDVTSVLSNASCLSSFENWLEAARLSRSGVLSRAAAGPPAQPTLNRLGP